MAEENPKIGKISVDRELCIGVATCLAVAPDTFELDEESKAVVKSPEGNTDAEIINAAKSCPVKAILLEDTDGKEISLG